MKPYKATGFVLPVGSGAVGKTSLARAIHKGTLPLDWAKHLNQTRKTTNIEFECIVDTFTYRGDFYKVLQQILVLPGQRSEEGDTSSRSFEQVLDIFRFHIRRIDVLLLSYNLTHWESFLELEPWLELASDLINENTSVILVGTHLDLDAWREVHPVDLRQVCEYLPDIIRELNPSWQGKLSSIEVSNKTGTNLDTLRRSISIAILDAGGQSPVPVDTELSIPDTSLYSSVDS